MGGIFGLYGEFDKLCDDSFCSRFPGIKVHLRTFESENESSKCKNYGIIPSSCLHRIFLFLDVGDLKNIYLTTRVFNIIGNTDFFWREYFNQRRKKQEEGKDCCKRYELSDFRSFLRKDRRFCNFRELYFELYGRSRFREVYSSFKLLISPYKTYLKSKYDSCKYVQLLVLGDYNVGKTTYLRRIAGEKYENGSNRLTIGVDFKITQMMIRDELWKIMIWDQPGGSTFRYYRNTLSHKDGIILCFSLDIKSSFDSIEKWHRDCMELYERKEIQFIVCGMKCDLRERKVVDHEMVKRMMYKLNISMQNYCECSSKDDLFIFYPVLKVIDGLEWKR